MSAIRNVEVDPILTQLGNGEAHIERTGKLLGAAAQGLVVSPLVAVPPTR